jgi:hypothetical protein
MTFESWPPPAEVLDAALRMGRMTRGQYEAAMIAHHPRMCADCGRKVVTDERGRYVALSAQGRTWWREYACRVTLGLSGPQPVVLMADYHCLDMAEQERYRIPGLDERAPGLIFED